MTPRTFILAAALPLLLAGGAPAQDQPQAPPPGQAQGSVPQGNVQVRQLPPNVTLQQAEPEVVVEPPQGQAKITVERMSRKEGALADAGLSRQDLVGMSAVGPQGDEVGEVKNLVLGPDGRRIDQVLIELSTGFLGMNSRIVAVPWDGAQIEAREKRVRLQQDEEALKQAPEFTAGADTQLLVPEKEG
ncbi:MAG TPA: PRC-barrel domain-containing protein [Azospirillaceae bacterium]|nr:PRC-barrel domain-containing protein [Azospirillaceae bacterium]